MPTKNSPEVSTPTASDFTQLVEAIVASQPKRQKTFSEHVVRSAFNPTGAKRKLPAVVYQNGVLLEEPFLTSDEISLLAKLQGGKFCNRRVTVHRDLSKPDRPWLINYDNTTPEVRMELKNEFRNFEELLKRITTEAPSQD